MTHFPLFWTGDVNQFLWNLAIALDIIHLFVVVPLLLSMVYFLKHCKVYGQWLASAS